MVTSEAAGIQRKVGPHPDTIKQLKQPDGVHAVVGWVLQDKKFTPPKFNKSFWKNDGWFRWVCFWDCHNFSMLTFWGVEATNWRPQKTTLFMRVEANFP